jgi:hypothetical protein
MDLGHATLQGGELLRQQLKRAQVRDMSDSPEGGGLLGRLFVETE